MGDIADCTKARHHATAEESRLPQRQPGWKPNGTVAVDDRSLREARGHEAVLQDCAIGKPQARRAVHQRPSEAVFASGNAEIESPCKTLGAVLARRDENKTDWVAYGNVLDALADLLDDAGAFMS